jgi:hypothetical protein
VNIFRAQRIASDGMSIASRWTTPAGVRLCYCLEPGMERVPHPGISSGLYPLRLRTVGAKHAAYLKWYKGDFHKGMVKICDVVGRDAIEFHVGNSISDTLGCSLCGESLVDALRSSSHHWEVQRSRVTYEKVYPVLRDAILAGPTFISIIPIGSAGA